MSMHHINDCLNHIHITGSNGKRVSISKYIGYNARKCASGKWVGREQHCPNYETHAIVAELEQEVKLAIWIEYNKETIECDDPELRLLCKRCADRYVQQEYREQSPCADSVDDDTYAKREDNIGRQYGSNDNVFEHFENAILVEDMLSYMPDKVRLAFVARHDLGGTWEQVAEAAGVKDRKTAMSLVRKGVDIAKHYLGKEDEEVV